MNPLDVLASLVPSLVTQAKQRAQLLMLIHKYQPIGRRQLADKSSMSERHVRTEIQQLQELVLCRISRQGIQLTEKGEQLIGSLNQLHTNTVELSQIEEKLMRLFGNKKIVVVPGDLTNDSQTIKLMGQAVSLLLNDYLPQGKVTLALSGGSVIAEIVKHINGNVGTNRQITIIPTRGSNEGEMAIQANTISHRLASIVDGQTRDLFVPEKMSATLLKAMSNDPFISETIGQLKKSNCLIYSIGSARIMAHRRALSREEFQEITNKEAIGESMGTFFDKEGNKVHQIDRIGLTLQDLYALPESILVVGGSHKAQALVAFMKIAPRQTSIVVDEALANSVLKEVTL